MIELTPRKRQDSHTQLIHFLILDFRVSTQRQSKFRIHIIEREFSFPVRTLHQQLHCTIAQQPNTDIHQEQVRLHQIAQFFDRRFLQHEIQLIWIPTRRNKHPMILGQIRIHPQTITYDIGFRNFLQRLTCTNIHISTGYQRMQRIRSILHDLLIQRKLQSQQVLRQALSACPTKHRYRRQNLARRCITRQTTALSSRMK